MRPRFSSLTKFHSTLFAAAISAPLAMAGMTFSHDARADNGAAMPYYWSGFYVGGHIGWAEATYRVGGSGGIFDGTDPNPTPLDADGLFGGGTVGYNWQDPVSQFGFDLVLGVEADIGYLDLSESNTTAGPVFGGNFARVEYGFYADIAARAGIAVDRVLAYAKAGIAIADIENTATDLDGGVIDAADFTSTDSTRTGYVIGGGLEYAIDEMWSVKGEYLYMDFGSTSSGNIDGDTWSHRDDVHTVKFGVNVKLGNFLGGM